MAESQRSAGLDQHEELESEASEELKTKINDAMDKIINAPRSTKVSGVGIFVVIIMIGLLWHQDMMFHKVLENQKTLMEAISGLNSVCQEGLKIDQLIEIASRDSKMNTVEKNRLKNILKKNVKQKGNMKDANVKSSDKPKEEAVTRSCLRNSECKNAICTCDTGKKSRLSSEDLDNYVGKKHHSREF